MSTAQPDRPAFEITVAGAALEPLTAADVVEIDVHEEVNRHGRCALLVQNWDADDRAVRHGDDGPFVPGADLAVALGYHADLTPVFDGVVASVTAHFPPRGRPMLRVEARSRSVLLEHPPRSRQLVDVTDADVVATVAADHGLTAVAGGGVQRPFVVSDRCTDWDFLKARADRLGWVLYARGKELVMHPPAEPSEPPVLEYTRDIVELNLTEDLTRAIDGAVGVGWDTAVVEPVESEQSAAAAGIETGDRDAHDAAVDDAGWPLREERDATPAVAAAAETDALALGRQRDAALGHLYGRAQVAGDATLRCDSWVEITGVGTRFSGPHYLAAVRHRVAVSGFITELQIGRPPALVPPVGPDRGHAGRTAPSGLLLGVVEAIDDPDKLNRVKVAMPWRADVEGVWARLATLDAGDGYGTVAVPDVGQEVLVGYVDGEADTPVVLGQLHNGKAAPPVVVDEKNAVRAQVTPGGHALRFDDSDAAKVELASGAGTSVVLDDANGALVLEHGDSGNTVTLSADGIELSAGKGDLVLKAPGGAVRIDARTFEGKATGPSSLESSATFDVKASGPLTLKGALVYVN